jgi:hypothetical protein
MRLWYVNSARFSLQNISFAVATCLSYFLASDLCFGRTAAIRALVWISHLFTLFLEFPGPSTRKITATGAKVKSRARESRIKCPSKIRSKHKCLGVMLRCLVVAVMTKLLLMLGRAYRQHSNNRCSFCLSLLFVVTGLERFHKVQCATRG